MTDSVTPDPTKIKFISLDSVVPNFGKWCGPGHTAGQDGIDFSRDDIPFLETIPVASLKLSDGSTTESNLDGLCKTHDIDYINANGLPNEAALKIQADLHLINGIISSLDKLTPGEMPYAVLAATAFIAKTAIYDVPATLVSSLKNDLGKLATYIGENSTPSNPFVMMEGTENLHTVLRDSDGNIVLGTRENDQSLTLTLGDELDKIGFNQSEIDEFGNVYDETVIEANLRTATTELMHASDGVEDLRGVIVGKLTQDKLDQFADLGSAALNVSDQSDNGLDHAQPAGSAATILAAMDVHVNSDTLPELDIWFDQSDAIFIEPYRWESVDNNLMALWQSSSDETLAAYDLGAALEEAGLISDIGAGDWMPPDVQPQFSDFGSDIGPVFYSSYDWPGLSTDSGWSNSYVDPLVLKLGAGSVHSTNLRGSNVKFDMNADGTKERTAWITADEGFLVMDRNGNGKVDNVSEMFSEYTSPNASTGFRALAPLDSNRDGWVDKWDKNFGQLRLWVDINVNGVTDKGELHALSEFGIYAISARASTTANHYDNGNLVLGTSSYLSMVQGSVHWGQVAEVLFNYGDHDPTATVYLTDQSASVRTENGKVIELLTDKAKQGVNASLSGVNVLVGGAGDILNAGNAGQSILIGNGKTTLNGNAGEVRFVVNGSGNVVNTGSGTSSIAVNGDANTINATKGDVTMSVDGNKNQITIGSGAEVALGGIGNKLTTAAKSVGNAIVVTGSGEIINASDAAIDLGDHSSSTLTGKNNHISMDGNATLSGSANGGTLTVSGGNNTATLSGAFVALTEGSALTLTGGNQKIVMAGDADLTMKSSGAGSTIYVFGDDNQLSSNSANVVLAEGAGLNLKGSGDKLSLLGDAELHASDTGHVIDGYGTGNEVTANRSTVNEHAFADVDLSGTSNILKVTPDNSNSAPQELAAQKALEQLLDKALHQFIDLTGELPGHDTPADGLGLPPAGGLALVGTDAGMHVADVLH